MGEFFKGWRRKIGVLTLVMALVFTVGWVRSISIYDRINLLAFVDRKPQECSYVIVSQHSCIMLLRWEGTKPFRVLPSDVFHSGPLAPSDPPNSGLSYSDECLGQFCGAAFRQGHAANGQIKEYTFVLHYWHFVLPLTLVSLWLLLTKPRKSTENKIAEPITEKVA